ncbi:hypothetical protein EJ04DRAFT_489829 [Polyplosphaeria fusca]|uniref:DUF1308 domain-containing protein n=1 Tax=Polyplosphaeria fusca TaxID=682080 RepID=A0A9P4R4A4_9PLEO|nr:hypothetical protein EJ04DRAFT_489829 [Polyplosphaeria fusca]
MAAEDPTLRNTTIDPSLASSLDKLSVNDLEIKASIADLIERCNLLKSEVEEYVAAAVEKNRKSPKTEAYVEYRTLKNDFLSELAFLNKVASQDLPEEKIRTHITSSNLVYYEALWSAAKRSSGIVSFRKYFFSTRQPKGQAAAFSGKKFTSKAKRKDAALVDIVAANGAEWIRVSTVSEKRMLFDLAKLGWHNDSDSEDEDTPDTRSVNWEDDDDDDQVEIVKNTRELVRVARANPTRGRPPTVTIILPRLSHGNMPKAIEKVLQDMKATGATIQCANEIPPTPTVSDAIPQMLVDRSRILSETLNIDCTILLALVSDISHKKCPVMDWYPGEVRSQIQEEEKEHLLPTHLYPIIGSHPMVCTQHAVDQMYTIINTLATDTERTRANILLAREEHASTPPDQLLKAWIDLSDYTPPDGFKLPIRVFPTNVDALIARLPKVAPRIASEIGPLNTAIFFHGWAEDVTTLSSNRVRAKQMENLINEHGLEDGETGPNVWLCGESRSLIAKEGRRK